jgi:5-methylcytosine-specific restriction endonuclease McrA
MARAVGWEKFKRNPDRYEKRRQKAYNKRNALLQCLGFKTYRDYLQSDVWKRIRRQVLERDQYKCFCCGRPATEVHHQKYSKQELMGTKLDKLVSICRGCHQNGEFFLDGTKTKVKDARSRMFWQRWKNGLNQPKVG